MGTGVFLLATSQHQSGWLAPSFDGRDVGGAGAMLGGAILAVVGAAVAGASSTANYRCDAAEECRSGRVDACNLLEAPP